MRDTERQPSENPTIYLGDSTAFQWDINNTAWGATFKKAGAGTVNTSAGMNWQDITWVDEAGDGYGGNEGVKSASFQGTSVGTWYYSLWIGWDPSVGSNGRWYNGFSTWSEGSDTFQSSSFTVAALAAPSSQSASAASGSQINLAWTKGVSGGSAKDTLILRSTSSSFTDPTPGTSYNVNDTIGSATVIYKGSGTSFNDAGRSAGTHYYYKLYAENYSYYSAGVTADACALVASFSSLTHNAGASAKVMFTELTGGVSGVSVTALSATTTGGKPLALNGADLASSTMFTVPSDAAEGDTFTYTIANADCSANGTVTIHVTSSSGQQDASLRSVVYNNGTGKYEATLKFFGVPTWSYHVQRATDVSFSQNLTTLGPVTAQSYGAIDYIDTDAPSSGAYYRLTYP